MVAGSAADAWKQHGVTIEVKRTFVQVAFEDHFDKLSRQQFPKSCPDYMFESEAVSQPLSGENEYSEHEVLIDASALIESRKAKEPVALSVWPVGSMTVKNTFINLVHDHDEDDEVILQAARRRDVQSCPSHPITSEESDVDLQSMPFLPSPDPWSNNVGFDFSDACDSMESLSGFEHFETNVPTESFKDSIDAHAAGHKHISTQEITLLRHLLLKDAASFQDNAHDSNQIMSTLTTTWDQVTGSGLPTPRGLPLSALPERSRCDCLEFMCDQPTPNVLAIAGWGKHSTSYAQHPEFFPAAGVHGVTSCRESRPLSCRRRRRSARIYTEGRIDHESKGQTLKVDDLLSGTCCEYDFGEACAPSVQVEPEATDFGEAIAANRGAVTALTSASHALKRNRRGGRGGPKRLWCHIYLDPLMLQDGFDLVKKLIGKDGSRTSKIYYATNTKVRIRGKGSGHRETPDGREAPVPLMIALAAEHGNADQFKKAFNMSIELLTSTAKLFNAFLRQPKAKCTTDSQGRRFWVGEISETSKMCLGELLNDLL